MSLALEFFLKQGFFSVNPALKQETHPTLCFNPTHTQSHLTYNTSIMDEEKPRHEYEEHASNTSVSPAVPYTIDKQAERALIRKLDRHIIPTVMTAYLLCFLDRTNIGNARIFGMEKELNMHGNMYQIAVAVLFIPYILIEVPSNLVIKKFRPSRWLPFITISWGIVSTLTGIVQNYTGLIVVRLLLGLLEGGLLPGLTVYLTLFYTKKEIALRFSYLFVATALAGACGGLLAYAIGFMDGIRGLSGWRWIFIIEGTYPITPAPIICNILTRQASPPFSSASSSPSSWPTPPKTPATSTKRKSTS